MDVSDFCAMFLPLEIKIKIVAAKLRHRSTKQLYYMPEARRVKRERKLSYGDISEAAGIPVGRLKEIFNIRGDIATLDELEILKAKLDFTLESPYGKLCETGVGVL